LQPAALTRPAPFAAAGFLPGDRAAIFRHACGLGLDGIVSKRKGIEVLEGALAIGRQADPIALPVMEERMSAAHEEVSSATSKAKTPLLESVKKLLNAL
jgi:hypothetical protein